MQRRGDVELVSVETAIAEESACCGVRHHNNSGDDGKPSRLPFHAKPRLSKTGGHRTRL